MKGCLPRGPAKEPDDRVRHSVASTEHVPCCVSVLAGMSPCCLFSNRGPPRHHHAAPRRHQDTGSSNLADGCLPSKSQERTKKTRPAVGRRICCVRRRRQRLLLRPPARTYVRSTAQWMVTSSTQSSQHWTAVQPSLRAGARILYDVLAHAYCTAAARTAMFSTRAQSRAHGRQRRHDVHPQQRSASSRHGAPRPRRQSARPPRPDGA